ncbi:MAG: sensor histidine kinase [Lachnospiraceae bacterium]|nr:sensor histidine kinase [Lachnospiraceae bacterium]
MRLELLKGKINSIKRTVLIFDFLIVVPLFILFCILTIAVFQKSNYEWNKSKLSAIEERSANISARNTEIIKITNMLYLDSEINQILSQKTNLTGYERRRAHDKIQKKMRELTELFPERQYQIMVLCSNGSNYFQNSLEFMGDEIKYEDLQKEAWYLETKDKEDEIYFLPQYRSVLLKELFPKDTLFAVRNIRNLNTGRKIGTVLVAISHDIWGKEAEISEKYMENVIVMDQYRKIIYASDPTLYGTDIKENSYYKKIVENEKGFFVGNVKNQKSHIRFSSIFQTGWKLISYEPYQNFWSFYVVLLLGLGTAMFLVLTFIVLHNCRIIEGRMKRLNKNILEVSSGNLEAKISENYEIEFQEIFCNFNSMLDKIQELLKQLEREEEEKHRMEIQALQAQINPHFFYNTLVTIRFMIQMEEYSEADQAILSFSKLLRKSFANQQKFITIKEEMDMVEEYLKLMSLRYKEKFQWKIIIEYEIAELGILKNLIQPLVENSISHGFNTKEEQGHIWIRAYNKDGKVIVEVEDDGVGVDLERVKTCIESREVPRVKEQFSGIGVSNIQMRIKRNFGDNYGMYVFLNEHGGTTFQVEIPVIHLEGDKR